MINTFQQQDNYENIIYNYVCIDQEGHAQKINIGRHRMNENDLSYSNDYKK